MPTTRTAVGWAVAHHGKVEAIHGRLMEVSVGKHNREPFQEGFETSRDACVNFLGSCLTLITSSLNEREGKKASSPVVLGS